jgi:hypothetical protein
VSDEQTTGWFSRRVPPPQPAERALGCGACGQSSDAEARGWRAYRVDGPAVAIVCPDCYELEVGWDH